MKSQLIILLGTFVCSTACISQSPDLQWLIFNGQGKSGFLNGSNSYTNGLTSDFTLQGVSLPNTNNDLRAGNDLFVIYSDANHFNSRNNTSLGRFYTAGSASTDSVHNFRNIHSSSIQYLYLTDKYETDDPPQSLRVTNGHIGTDSPYPTDVSSASNLSASHEVVFTKDITLIINLDRIKKAHHLGEDFDLRLTFNAVQDISHAHHVQTGLNIFDTSPAFNDGGSGYTHAYPVGSISAGSHDEEVIIRNGQEDYRYVNLTTNNNALSYAPVENEIYEAVFTLNLNGVRIDELREEIRHSHDPNFLRVDSIAKASDGGYYVFYHLEFENDGTMHATALQAKVKFQPMFDLSDLQTTKWFSGEPLSLSEVGTHSIGRDSCVFYFPTGHPLYPCTTPTAGAAVTFLDTTKCRGFVEFRVKVKPGHDVTNPDVSLLLKEPKVSMDGTWYDLNEFYDLVRIKRSFPLAAQLYRPAGEDVGEPCIPAWVWIIAVIAAILLLLLFIFRKRIFA